MSRIAYKLIPRKYDWGLCLRLWTTKDLQDGFVHMSSHQAVRGTARKHFKTDSYPILVSVNLDMVEGEIRTKGSYVHLYDGYIPERSIRWTWELYPTKDGKDFKYPKLFDREGGGGS